MRFAFGEDEVKRIAKAVKAFEQGQGSSDLKASGPRHVASHLSLVKVTTPATPYSTGKCVDFIASDGTYVEKETVKIKDVGGKTLSANSYHVGYFAGYKQGEPVFFVTLGGEGGGTATIDVVTDVVCTPTGLEVSTATFAGANYDTAIIRKFLSLSDVVPKSFLGNQGRVVRVNEFATGLEFGPVAGELAQTFIALEDTPLQYGNSAYKVLIVSSANDGVSFSDNNITTQYSVDGGGNPNDPRNSKWEPLQLKGDVEFPGNNKFYGTSQSGSRGWYDIGGNQKSSMSVTGDGSSLTPITLLNDEETPAANYVYGTNSLGVKGWQSSVSFDYVDDLFDGIDSRVLAIENAPYATQSYVTTAVGNEATERTSADSALDGRISTLEGQNLDSRLTTSESNITTLQSEMDTAQGDITGLDGRLDVLESQTLNTRLTSVESAVATLQGDVSSLDGRLTTAEGNISTTATDILTINTTLTTVQSNITSLQSDVSTLQSDVSTIQSDLTFAQSNITTLQGDVTTLQTGLSTAEGNIATLQSDVSTLQSNLTSAEGNITTLQSDVSTLQSGLTTAEGSITTLQGDVSTLQTSLSTAESNITNLQSDLATAQSDIVTLQSDLATAQSDIVTLLSDLATSQSDIVTLQSNLSTAQSDISTLQSDYTALEARVAALEGA